MFPKKYDQYLNPIYKLILLFIKIELYSTNSIHWINKHKAEIYCNKNTIDWLIVFINIIIFKDDNIKHVNWLFGFLRIEIKYYLNMEII